MAYFLDQTGRSIELQKNPGKIISLVPSQTELLFDLGLDAEVTGITKFCIHPNHWYRNKARVGGTKTINIPLITSLQPDLIIANKEENVKSQIEALENIAPVWVSDINKLSDAIEMIQSIGEITGRIQKAGIITTQIKTDFEDLRTLVQQANYKKYRTAYLIWENPYMAAGADTFIHNILQLCGWENICADKNRYPEINIADLHKKNTELILLSSEPFPFRQKHIDNLQKKLPRAKIVLVDGEMFSWYGSRLLQTVSYLKTVLAELN